MAVKLFKPYVSYQAIWNVIKVLLSSQLAEGPQVKAFEREFALKFSFNPQNIVAVNSGTSALELAYELANINEGDEVISSVLTCTATNIPLLHRKAKIVFADIDYDLNINIKDVEKKITNKTKAIVFVHFGGNNRGLAELSRLCQARGLTLIEDAAQAVGSDYWGKGDFTCVSLQAIKTLTSGDGGFIITKRKEDADKAKRLRWFGYDREEKQRKGDTDIKEAGYKYHMNDITAAIGRGNLRSFDKLMAKRKKLKDYYNNKRGFLIRGMIGIECHNWLCIQYGEKGEQHHYRNDKYTIFKQFKNDCPIMDEMEDYWRLLPYHHDVTLKQAHDAIYKS